MKVTAAPRGGLVIDQPPQQPDPVAASSSANVTLSLRGAAAGEDTHLRVSATGVGISDAIDKPLRIHPDGERVERSVTDGSEPIQLQLTTTWYEPWTKSHLAKDFGMATEFSTTRAAVNQAVTCRVKITRPAFLGYGMMIAEIGLPPGAEADRGTLEASSMMRRAA